MPEPLEPIHHIYEGYRRKLCEVQLEDGDWVIDEVRSWDRDEQGQRSAFVFGGWTRRPGLSTFLDRFPEESVRAVQDGWR